MDAKYYRGLSESEKQSMKDGIFRRLKIGSGVEPQPMPRIGRRIWVGVAASLLVILSGWLYYITLPTTKPTGGQLVVRTGAGEIRKLRLSDSSVVILNPNSSITYSSDLSEGPRNVELSGNAFFQVKKEASLRRFVVHAGTLAVTVVGTQFNVNARNPRIEVTLASGKVDVNWEKDSSARKHMVPGDKVTADPQQKTFASEKVDPDIYSAWTKGEWTFRNTKLEDISELIREYYGVACVFNDPLKKNYSITGLIPVNSLDGLLQVIRETLQINISQKENQVFIQ